MSPTPRPAGPVGPVRTDAETSATTPPPPDRPKFEVAVLCGGRSRRMGQDKALILVEGQPMVRRVADAALAAGAVSVVALGGDAAALAAIGIACRADAHPGEGPLPAILDALRWCATEVLLVVPCDLVAPSPAAMATTARALVQDPAADLAVAVDGGGRRQWAHAAWRTRAAAQLSESLASGSRSLVEATATLAVREVAGLDPAALRDADRPEDLPGAG